MILPDHSIDKHSHVSHCFGNVGFKNNNTRQGSIKAFVDDNIFEQEIVCGMTIFLNKNFFFFKTSIRYDLFSISPVMLLNVESLKLLKSYQYYNTAIERQYNHQKTMPCVTAGLRIRWNVHLIVNSMSKQFQVQNKLILINILKGSYFLIDTVAMPRW